MKENAKIGGKMENLYIILVLLGIIILGFIVTIYKKRDIDKRYNFVKEYLDTTRIVGNLISDDKPINEQYTWLQYHVIKIQKELGPYGIISAYKPAYADYYHRNYEIMLNGIREIKDLYVKQSSKRQIIDLIMTIDDILLMYLGHLNTDISALGKKMLNPFILLREGLVVLITLPLRILYWSELINYASVEKLERSVIFKILSFVIYIITVLSSVLTLIIGYEDLMEIIKNIF